MVRLVGTCELLRHTHRLKRVSNKKIKENL